MRVICDHGHYRFYPTRAKDIQEFAINTQSDIIKVNDYYTFKPISELKNYSIKGAAYGGVNALHTFEGEPWAVMRKNNLVYSLKDKKIVSIDSIKGSIEIFKDDAAYLSETMFLQAGGVVNKKKLASYDGTLGTNSLYFLIRSIELI